jgi:hypothetical protein
MSYEYWTPAQWAAFAAVATLGVIGVLAAAGALRATNARAATPQPLRAVGEGTITAGQLQALRERWAHAVAEPARVLDAAPVQAWEWDDEQRAHLKPGVGSITSVMATPADPERNAREWAWVHAYDGTRHAAADALDAALADFRIAVEPAMRKARLWEIRGQASQPRRELDHWRIDTPTGEWPMAAFVLAATRA